MNNNKEHGSLHLMNQQLFSLLFHPRMKLAKIIDPSMTMQCLDLMLEQWYVDFIFDM